MVKRLLRMVYKAEMSVAYFSEESLTRIHLQVHCYIVGQEENIIISDEFDTDERPFYPGEDPFGRLRIYIIAERIHGVISPCHDSCEIIKKFIITSL